MTFFFSLPQTLLRQLSINNSQREIDYVFVFESTDSTSGRDNYENFEISKEILRELLPDASLNVYRGDVPPSITQNDGVGEELLRSKSYGWTLTTSCMYIVQHSCFSWESINLHSLLAPSLFLRAILRTRKLYRRNRFKRIYVYAGSRIKNLRHSLRPWQRIYIIDKKSLEIACKKATGIKQLHSRQFCDDREKNSILIMASGNFADIYHEVCNRHDPIDNQIIIKQHPQQESFLPELLDDRTYIVTNRHVPAELVVEKYKPVFVYGSKSTLEYYLEGRYRVYDPILWRYSRESDLLARHRQLMERPLIEIVCKFVGKSKPIKVGLK